MVYLRFQTDSTYRDTGPIACLAYTFGTGIPCFIVVPYGKAFGTFINDRRFARDCPLELWETCQGWHLFIYLLRVIICQ